MKGSIGGFFNIRRQYRINLKNKLKAKKITKIIVMPFIFVYSIIGYNINIKNKKEKIKQSEQFIIENKKHKQEANIHTLQYVKDTPKKEIKKTKNISLFKVTNNEKKDKQENVLSKPITIAKKQASKFKTTKKVQELKNTKQKEQKSRKKIIVEIKPAQELKKDKLNTNDKSFIIDWVKIKIEELKKIDEEINELETQIKNCTNYKDTYEMERKIKELLKRLNHIKKDYENLIEDKKITKETKLYATSKLEEGVMFINYINILNNDYKQIYDVKRKILTPTKKEEQSKNINKQNEIKQEKKQEKKKTELELINEEILLQIEYFKRLSHSKGSKIFNLKNIMFLGISYYMNPFPKIISSYKYLASLVVLNNCLKAMRKMIEPNSEEYMLYAFQEELELYNKVLLEIILLKDSLINRYNEKEIITILEQLNNLEKDFNKKVKELSFQKTLKRNIA